MIGTAAVVLIIIVVILFFNLRQHSNSQQALNISVWGTDSPKAWNDLINNYTGPGSGTSMVIKYTQIDPSNYQNTILSALAAGNGPDIFEIGNRDLPQWSNFITPVPTALATTFSTVTLQNDFPTVVGQDFGFGGYVYALPLSVDTLAMIYNKDLLDSAGITSPPKTWSDFESDIPALKKTNSQGQITQAAAAIGGTESSIANAPDLVFLLMLQNDTQMVSSDYTSVRFASDDTSDSSPGMNAFNFYLQFANAASPNYTWNDTLGNTIDAFSQGKTAIIFDYASSLANIKARAPFLNIGIAPMPQPANATVVVNYPKYSGLVVNKYSASYLSAWTFIINLTTSAANEKIYTTDTGTPPALRSSIQADLTDPTMSVFASQALTARSWYEKNSERMDGIMNSAIGNVLNGSANSTAALTEAQAAANN